MPAECFGDFGARGGFCSACPEWNECDFATQEDENEFQEVPDGEDNEN